LPQVKINGVEHNIDAEPQMPLLWAIRDIVGLTGAKFGCGMGACGACTVHIDDQAVRSRLTSLADAQGHEIVTVEGLSAEVPIRSSALGRRTTSPNAAIAKPARSCRPRHCSSKHQSRPTSRSSMQ
jgi:isoquinoline 1-oxidoreductase alpha subunit